MPVGIIRVRHVLTSTRGGRGAREAKWSDFTFLLKKIIGFADGLDMGYVTKRGDKDDPRFLVLFISRIFNNSSVF